MFGSETTAAKRWLFQKYINEFKKKKSKLYYFQTKDAGGDDLTKNETNKSCATVPLKVLQISNQGNFDSEIVLPGNQFICQARSSKTDGCLVTQYL
jgi:hypothetical protein